MPWWPAHLKVCPLAKEHRRKAPLSWISRSCVKLLLNLPFGKHGNGQFPIHIQNYCPMGESSIIYISIYKWYFPLPCFDYRKVMFMHYYDIESARNLGFVFDLVILIHFGYLNRGSSYWRDRIANFIMHVCGTYMTWTHTHIYIYICIYYVCVYLTGLFSNDWLPT